MPITVAWDDDERTAIRYEFESYWSWQDFRAAAGEVRLMMGTVDYEVPTIADFTHSGPVPNGAITQVKRAISAEAPNAGIVVIAGADAFIVAVAKVFLGINRSLRHKVAFVDTVADARALLHARSNGQDKAI